MTRIARNQHWFSAAAIATLLLLHHDARAQELGIVAVVNDEAISAFDVAMRMQVAVSSARLPDTPEVRERLGAQVLRSLIDETLQKQEAARRDFTISNAELDEAIQALEERNNIPPGGFEDYLARQGIELLAVRAQVEAELAWGKVISSEVQANVRVSEEQIDEAEARIRASEGKHRLLLAEIFLAIDEPQRAAEIEVEA